MVINPTQAKAELSKLIFRHIPDEPFRDRDRYPITKKIRTPLKTDRRIFTPAAAAGVNFGVFIAFFALLHRLGFPGGDSQPPVHGVRALVAML